LSRSLSRGSSTGLAPLLDQLGTDLPKAFVDLLEALADSDLNASQPDIDVIDLRLEGVHLVVVPALSAILKRQDPPKRAESGEAGNHPAGDSHSAAG